MDVSEIAAELRADVDANKGSSILTVYCGELRAILDDRERAWRNYNEELDNLRDRNEELDAAETRITQLEQELATAREALRGIDENENQFSMRWAAERARAFLTKDTPDDRAMLSAGGKRDE